MKALLLRQADQLPLKFWQWYRFCTYPLDLDRPVHHRAERHSYNVITLIASSTSFIDFCRPIARGINWCGKKTVFRTGMIGILSGILTASLDLSIFIIFYYLSL